MAHSPTEAPALITAITHCPELRVIWELPADPHPCRLIVESQPVKGSKFQVPEPWTGHLEHAPLLFVSSNPSIGQHEVHPLWEWDRQRTIQYFENRFGPGHQQVKEGVYCPLSTPDASGRWHTRRPVNFWNICLRNATWLFGRPVEPGIDYVMTEVVHCKSRKELGVDKARDRCADRWLLPVLTLSPATVIAVLGESAKVAFERIVKRPLRYWDLEEVNIGGMQRIILAARHPNYRGKRKWPDFLSVADQTRLRAKLLGKD